MFCSNKEYKKKKWPNNNVNFLPPIETQQMVSCIILNVLSIGILYDAQETNIHNFSCFVYAVPILKKYNWILIV